MFKGFNTSLRRSKSMKHINISEPLTMFDASGFDQSSDHFVPPIPSLPISAGSRHISTSSNSNHTINSPSISTPVFSAATTPRTTPASSTVILITKFDFKSEHQNELTVGVGEALKLIERKGNGWILVKPIGRVSNPGLIPASYVRIVKLNKNQPSDIELDAKWLASEDQEEEQTVQEYKTKCSSVDSSMSSDQEQHSFSQSTLSTSRASSPSPSSSIISKNSTTEEFPVTGLVKNVSCYNGRYWYRVDLELNNGKKRHLCRYYQDFYKLHCSIIDALRILMCNESEEAQDVCLSKLPGLPDPIPRPDLETLTSILLQRCQSLNLYIFKIVQNKHRLNYEKVLSDWCLPRLGDLECDAKDPLSNANIETSLSPCPIVYKTHSNTKPSLSIQTSVTPPLSVPDLPPNSIFTHRMNSSFSSPVSSPMDSPKIWPSPNKPNTMSFRDKSDSMSGETTRTSKGMKQPSHQSGDNWMTTPTEPLFSNRNSNEKPSTKRNESISSNISSTYNENIIKLKIFHNDDIFAIRFNKTASIQDLKMSISKRLECETKLVKLYYKNASKNYFTPLSDEFDLHSALDQSKVSVKVHLW